MLDTMFLNREQVKRHPYRTAQVRGRVFSLKYVSETGNEIFGLQRELAALVGATPGNHECYSIQTATGLVCVMFSDMKMYVGSSIEELSW